MSSKVFRIRVIRKMLDVDIVDMLAVKSKVEIVTDGAPKYFDSIENIDYLVPCGVYYLQKELSPKFKSKLWELKAVHGRSEIKFHRGNRSSHSKGCLLMSDADLRSFMDSLDASKRYIIEILNLEA